MEQERFELIQLKYTIYHWMSGEIVNGCPVTTSIEIKTDITGAKWIETVNHTYMLEIGFEEKTLTRENELVNPEAVIGSLEKVDLRNLKNNYFSNDKIQRYSHWELEYNYYFKISGTFDNEPEEIKKIKEILNCETIINEELSKVEKIIKNDGM